MDLGPTSGIEVPSPLVWPPHRSTEMRTASAGTVRHAAGTDVSLVAKDSTAVAPPCKLFSMVSLPPCALTIVEQIESPRPRPFSFLLKKGSKSRR